MQPVGLGRDCSILSGRSSVQSSDGRDNRHTPLTPPHFSMGIEQQAPRFPFKGLGALESSLRIPHWVSGTVVEEGLTTSDKNCEGGQPREDCGKIDLAGSGRYLEVLGNIYDERYATRDTFDKRVGAPEQILASSVDTPYLHLPPAPGAAAFDLGPSLLVPVSKGWIHS
ncbi:hypothetical protein BO86DRAFT_45679 [Aspergillus japonicus CBS 114.51]|uniref:Uncharacterized protein n=1 Tax=Aspergillus japonicus CBS 114.51 TaxID=1448312 RepID=A0A8T8WK73_ASPJA|nr:hypothetical protein BO86DRAFT_45679 [Aspergillus japonicus CBS 114.51]RAH75869.1 hypothetical protein BO86DRAFT_45679 [Aspergillus japonicus CBS 114.51]